MQTNLTKRAVSLLTVVALLLTMFTGMMFTVSAEGDGTVTTLLPITDASDWTGRTDKITTNGTFAAVTGEGNERVITSVDTFDFGNQLMVSGTLVQRAFSGNQTAKSYVKVGNFKFEIEDDLTTLYVRAVIGEETVYEKTWSRAELGNALYSHFQQVDFNAAIDNTAKTVTIDYKTGSATAPTNNTGSGTYTGNYSFDNVSCVASYKSNWLTNNSNEVVGVLNFSVTKYDISETIPAEFITLSNNENYGTVIRTSDEDVYEGDSVTILATPAYGYKFVKWVDQNGDTYQDLGATATVTAGATNYYKAVFEAESEVEVSQTATNLIPITDTSAWTGRTDKITTNGTFAAVTGEGNERIITSVETFDFGNQLMVSGTLVQRTFSGNQTAKSYVKVGNFKFEIEDDLTTLYVRAVMGEETVYEKAWTRTELGDALYSHFQQVDFNAAIDNTAKTVTIDYTTGSATAPTNNTGSGTYTGNYSFDDVSCVASYKSNWLTNSSSEVAGVLDFSVTKYDISETFPVDFTILSNNQSYGTVTRAPFDSIYYGDSVTITATPAYGYQFVKWVDQNGNIYQNLTSTATVIADSTNYYKAIFKEDESDYLVENLVEILPDTNVENWTGDTGYISNADVVLNGYTYAPAGSLVVNQNTNKVKTITTADAYDLGDNFKISGALSIYSLSASNPTVVYTSVGNFKFEIGDDLTNLYVKVNVGDELIYENYWQKANNGSLLHQVKFNATIDNNTKTVNLNYTTGPVNNQTTHNGLLAYTGDYSFDDITCTASVKNNWLCNTNAGRDVINVAVSNLAVTKYERLTTPVTFTAMSDNQSYGTVTRTPAGDVYVGDEVTICATPASGYVFKAWVDQNNNIYTNLGQTAVVKVGKTNHYKALFVSTDSAVTITVNAQNGQTYNYYSANSPTIEGMLSEDETIRRAVTVFPGYELSGWVDAQGNTVDADKIHTENITVIPTYTINQTTYTITVDGVSGTYAFNTEVTAVSDNADFSYWSENGEVASFANPYRFFAAYDRALTSVSDSSFQPQPIIKISNMWNEKGYDYVLTEWAIPSNYQFVSEGVIMTKSSSVDLTYKTLVDVDNDTIRVATTKNTNSAGQYMIYNYQDSKLKVKAFLTYKDAQGVKNTIYTQVKSGISDYYATDDWQPVDVVSAEYKGEISEGCQWTTNIVFDQSDENGLTAFLCLDTAGPYKTTDGGQSWKPSSLGWAAGGSQSLAIDPYNSNHIVGAGNSAVNNANVATQNGVYLSLDGGDTWEMTLHHHIGSPRTYVNQFVFDPTSYNEQTGMCMTVYWSSEDYSENTFDNDPKLFKSTDGGVTWTSVNSDFGGCHLEISSNGTLFAAKYPCYLGTSTGYDMGETTIYKSTNGGVTFTALNISNVRTFDVQNDVLYVSTTTGFYKSTDNGSSFTKVNTNIDYKELTQMLAVSPNGQDMVMQIGNATTGSYREKYYSANGGVTWSVIDVHTQVTANSFMPVNPRVSAASFSGADHDLVISNYGDTIIRSEDGGATWETSNLGYNTICTGQISFNVNNQNLMIVPCQDYNGAYSTDGGQTFTYLNWSGKSWGGFTYGGYIIDENNMFVICTNGWWDGATEKYVYRMIDGEIIREKIYAVADDATQASLGSVKNNNIAFVGDLRTTDKGVTFSQMNKVYNNNGILVSDAYVIGVMSVQLDNASGHFGRLYGRDNTGYLVYSDDDGATWYQFADFRSKYDGQIRRIMGMSCDQNGYIYVFSTEYYGGTVEVQKTTITEGKLSQMTDIVSPIDSQGKWNGSLTVDYYTGTLYLGSGTNMQPKNTNIACMWRSEDGGKTWVELSVHLDENLEKVGNPITEVYPTGDVTRIIINYQTNEVFAVFTNHGIWKIGRQY